MGVTKGLGWRLAVARAIAGLTQVQAAEKFGVDRPRLSEWESGKGAPMGDMAAIVDAFIADAFEVALGPHTTVRGLDAASYAAGQFDTIERIASQLVAVAADAKAELSALSREVRPATVSRDQAGEAVDVAKASRRLRQTPAKPTKGVGHRTG